MQKRIAAFIKKKYLCTVCCTLDDKPWANAFYYAFDEAAHRLLFVSSDQTHHGKVILQNPQVSGTIFTPTRFNPSLQGVQFTGKAKILTDNELKIGRKIYLQHLADHQLIYQLPMWEISLEYVRLIDHSLGLFGTLEWKLGEPEKDAFEEFEQSIAKK